MADVTTSGEKQISGELSREQSAEERDPESQSASSLRLGANLNAGGECEFRVWAPKAQRVEIKLQRKARAGEQAEVIAMRREDDGHFALQTNAAAGDKYAYMVDGGAPLPDPVSRLLPDGVHGSTEIVAADAFPWTDSEW